jgi:benzoyl-CoA-dihydrodiol lyase
VRTVIVTSAKEKVFCSGANIFMLGVSSHAWKVNFCKFTNETRNGLEDSSKNSGLKFLAAVNGACAGGGYELALACDEIILVDDRNSAVSLPEVPLLGVLPGTGGLTRVTDKRHVRHDLATSSAPRPKACAAEGGGMAAGGRSREAQPVCRPRAGACAAARRGQRPARRRQGVELTPLERTIEADALRYSVVNVEIDRRRRVATFTVKAPAAPVEGELAAIEAQGAAWYPLRLGRELEDAILCCAPTSRTSAPGCSDRGQGGARAFHGRRAAGPRGHWFVRETIGYLRRTFSRLDVSSRSLFALIEQGSCFAGSLLELALACDRSYQLALPDDPSRRRRSKWPRRTSASTPWPPARAAWAAASTTRRRRWPRCARASASRWTPAPPSRSAS